MVYDSGHRLFGWLALVCFSKVVFVVVVIIGSVLVSETMDMACWCNG